MICKDLARKLKIQRVEVCLNCKRFLDCDDIGKFVECENFLEVETNRAMVIVSLEDNAKLESRR